LGTYRTGTARCNRLLAARFEWKPVCHRPTVPSYGVISVA
jgi:hypothetical protein